MNTLIEAQPPAPATKQEKSPSVIQRLTAQITELLLQPDRTLAIQLGLGACYLSLKRLCPPKELLATLERLAAQFGCKSKFGGGQSGNTVRNLRHYATLVTKYARLTANPPGTTHPVAPSQQLSDLKWLIKLAFGVTGLAKQLLATGLNCAAELVRQARVLDPRETDPTLSWHAACSRLRLVLQALPLADRQAAMDLIADQINPPSASPPAPAAMLDAAA